MNNRRQFIKIKIIKKKLNFVLILIIKIIFIIIIIEKIIINLNI